MPSRDKTHLVTANDLLDGDVVYFTAERCWTRDHREAALVHGEEAAALLAAAEAQQGQVVGPYLAPFSAGPEGPEPDHFREVFRLRGPSNRPDLGRQAERR